MLVSYVLFSHSDEADKFAAFACSATWFGRDVTALLRYVPMQCSLVGVVLTLAFLMALTANPSKRSVVFTLRRSVTVLHLCMTY